MQLTADLRIFPFVSIVMFERMSAGPNTLWGTLDECITGLPQQHRHSQSAGGLGETGPHAAVKQVETQGNNAHVQYNRKSDHVSGLLSQHVRIQTHFQMSQQW